MMNEKNRPRRCVCGAPSLKNLSQPVCAYEWARANWGEAWANKLYPTHPHRAWEPKSVMGGGVGQHPQGDP